MWFVVTFLGTFIFLGWVCLNNIMWTKKIIKWFAARYDKKDQHRQTCGHESIHGKYNGWLSGQETEAQVYVGHIHSSAFTL